MIDPDQIYVIYDMRSLRMFSTLFLRSYIPDSAVSFPASDAVRLIILFIVYTMRFGIFIYLERDLCRPFIHYLNFGKFGFKNCCLDKIPAFFDILVIDGRWFQAYRVTSCY